MSKIIRKIIPLSLILTTNLLFVSNGFAQIIPAKHFLRNKLNFNGEWKFTKGDIAGAELSEYNDAAWESVGLPHSFSMPYFLSSDFYVGYGWYRKLFHLPAAIREKKIFIEFEAAFQDAEVFINGKKVGEHKGGYTGFSLDISNAVVAGDNIVAVRLNNIWNPGLAPRAGEHTFSGGLYRDVYLVLTNLVHVDWYGTFVTTQVVNEKNAIVKIKTEIQNSSKSSVDVQLKTDILTPEGKKITTVISSKKIPANTISSFWQTSNLISTPKLWNIEHPYLYTAVSSVFVDGIKKDEYRTTFGIRSIKWTADSGFYLNDKPLYLRGANVHEDHAGWGDAVTNEGFYRDVKMMKDAGFNFIRGSHYPHDPAFIEACDKLGMVYWSENVFWGIGGSANTPEGNWISSAYPTKEINRQSFEVSLKQQLQEMIRIHRNSPSVIAWSMSNEPFFTAKETLPHVRKLLKELVEVAHVSDSTRPAAIGGAQRPLDSTRIDLIGDMAGYNGDGGTIPVFQNPGIPNLVSEYGSVTTDRPGKYEPGWGDIAKDNGKRINSWRSGQAIWCGFDHGSVAGIRLGKMGIVDYFRIPKRAWYWYRNEYRNIQPPEWPQPGKAIKLRLEADKNIVKTDGTDDVKLLVTVLDVSGKPLSNNPTVELTIVSGPGEFPTGNNIIFEEKSDIHILDGQAAIEFRSWYAGKSIIRATSPGLQAAEISIQFVGSNPYVKGVTPIVSRPYIRFSKKEQQRVTQHYGQNNPAYGSSFTANHPTGFATDGNKNTWWQALENDAAPIWKLDTEKKLSLQLISVTFPAADVYQYVIEVSENGINWKVVDDLMSNNISIQYRQIKLNDIIGGLVRIRFKEASFAKIAELDVEGIVID